MSVKIIAYLNPVKNDRTIFEGTPGSIKDIIKSLNTGFPASQARVSRNGEIIKDFDLTAIDGDTLWIKFVPYGSNEEVGAGMKVGGWALAFLGFGIMALAGWTGIGALVGAALMGTGLSMALGGQVLMNTNIPSLEDREKPDNDPSVRGSKNQSRPHGRIPVLFGKHRIYPDLAANPHTSIIGNHQYLTQLFCGGYKDCVIDLDSFKLGDTKLIDLSSTKNIQQILAGADPVVKMEILQNGEASALYPHCVHEDVVNAPIQKEIDDGDGGKIPGELIRTTPDNTNEINVDIFLYNGIGEYNDKGELGKATVEIKASYKNVNDNYYTPLGYFNNGSNTISGSSLKTMRFQITKSDLPLGKYDVKIERVKEDSTDSKIVDTVHVGSIRAVKSKDKDGKPVRPIRAERQKDLTIIALRVMATAKLNNVIDSFNYVAKSKLPICSANTSGFVNWETTAETSNPASMLLYALKGRASQQRVDDNDIDWDSLNAFYKWCEDHDYKCNAYLSESVTIAELMRMIGNTSRADILRIDSKISVVQDIERPAPVQLFTPKNTVGYSITMFNADVPDAIALRYIDEAAGYAQNELQVFNTPDGNREGEPATIQKVDLWGITDDKQARRIGMYNYACIKNRPFVHSIDVDIEYLLCNKGDWIQYAGDIALTGSVQGRIKEILWSGSNCIGVRLDEPVVITHGKQYAIRLRLSDGRVLLVNVSSVDESTNAVYFADPVAANKTPKENDVYAFGIRGQEVVDLIITDIQPGANFSAALTCVEYSPEIFNVDAPDFKLPDFENKITPVSGAIDSGVIFPDQWQIFTAYNDSDEEPARPTGAGIDDGWYHGQTVQSRWMSNKRAPNINEGVWSSPLRVRGEDGQFTDYRFAKNNALNIAPDFAGQDEDNPGDNWLDAPPVLGDNEYLWMITSDWRRNQRLTPWSLPARISGPAGIDGIDGRGITSIIYAYKLTDNDTKPSATDTGWSESMPVTTPANRWLWFRETTKFTDNTPDQIIIGLQAVHGQTGDQGKGISSRQYKYKVTNSATTPTQGWTDSGWLTTMPSTSETNRWLWFIERTTFSDNTTQDIIGLQAVHGQTGATGNYHESRYMRAVSRPATPAGDSPSGWTTDPSSSSGTDPLWMTRGIKNASGVLQGAWSVPVKVTGENGLGIDNIPRDAWAYWSCDELPQIPDNTVGQKYRNDFLWTDWVAMVNGIKTVTNGIITLTNADTFGSYLRKTNLSWSADDIVIIRARRTAGSGNLRVNPNNTGAINFTDLSADWKVFISTMGADVTNGSLNVYTPTYQTAPYTIEISDLYIGNASYLTPLLDNSGNRRHMRCTGVLPVTAVQGNGLSFLGTHGAYIYDTKELFYPAGDFTISAWIKKVTTGENQYIISNTESGGLLIIVNTDGRMRFGVVGVTAGSTQSVYAAAPDNEWIYVIAKFNSSTNTISIKINNSTASSLLVSGGIRWPAAARGVPLVLGANPGQFSTAGVPSMNTDNFLGQLDEVAVLTRLTTDDEDRAMYLTTLPKFYTDADWRLDPQNPQNAMQQAPRYRGAAENPDTTNTGIVSTTQGGNLRMNHLDWVLFNGTTQFGIWTPAYLCQWNAVDRSWSRLERPNNWEKYLDAISDITEGAPTGVFSTVFVKNLFAQTLNTEVANILFKLIVGSGTNGIEIDGRDGLIKSSNYVPDQSGFILKKTIEDGVQAEFTNMKVSGNLQANVSLQGGVSRKLYGGVRDYLIFKYENNTASIIETSIPNATIYRSSTGIFVLGSVWDSQSLIGEGYADYAFTSIGAQRSTRYYNGLRIYRIEKSLSIFTGGVDYSSTIHVRDIISNTLRDPIWACIQLIA